MSETRIIRAGAGTGKTYQVCEEITKKILAGADPSRIIATTFTIKAAAELKQRIESRILDENSIPFEERIRLAERLELSMIDTIHSVGLTLLSRYAIAFGLSPRLKVLEPDPGTRHLDRIIAAIHGTEWSELHRMGRTLSQDDPIGTVRSLLECKRTNRMSDDDFREQMKATCAEFRLLMSGGANLVSLSFEELFAEVERAIGGIRESGDSTKKAAGAAARLSQILRERKHQWGEFLRAGRVSSAKASGHCVAPLQNMLQTVRRSRELHADLQRYTELLTSQTIALEESFRNYKKERGLVDFTDMEELTLDLLNREDLEESLRAEIDFVVVDEFQDTNPIQLAIFQRLQEIACESVWVGDEKQAIYGFRGTDIELMRAAWNRVPARGREQLETSYRSHAGLVNVANALFAPAFGEECALEANDQSLVPGAVERWLLPVTRVDDECAALVRGIAALIDEGTPPDEIAVLVRTNNNARSMAKALEERGISAVAEQPGLLSSRECALAFAGLRLVADRLDSLARVTIEHILGDPEAETPNWFMDELIRAKQKRDARAEAKDRARASGSGAKAEPATVHESVRHPAIEALREIDPTGLDPAMVLADVIEALALPVRIGSWAEAPRRARKLDVMIELAQRYESEAGESGEAVTLTGLIQFLESLAGDGQDLQPTESVANAVQVMTYHGAKGLEWPVVVMTQLDFDHNADVWAPAVSGGKAEEGRPLEGRRIRNWIWPFGKTNPPYGHPTPRKGSRLIGDANVSPEGLEAARRETEEAKRLLYVGFTRAKRKVVLAHRPDKYKWLELLSEIDEVLPVGAGAGEHALASSQSTLIVRELGPAGEEAAESADESAASSQFWFPAHERKEKPHYADRFYRPSGQPDHEGAEEFVLEAAALPGANPFSDHKGDVESSDFGNAVHAYFAALPSLLQASEADRVLVATRCLRDLSMKVDVRPEQLVRAGERLLAWIESTYPGARWWTEVYVQGARESGGTWRGIADLLIKSADGTLVIVDHKTHAWEGMAPTFAGQLLAYQEALQATGVEVGVKWVHMPVVGKVFDVRE